MYNSVGFCILVLISMYLFLILNIQYTGYNHHRLSVDLHSSLLFVAVLPLSRRLPELVRVHLVRPSPTSVSAVDHRSMYGLLSGSIYGTLYTLLQCTTLFDVLYSTLLTPLLNAEEESRAS